MLKAFTCVFISAVALARGKNDGSSYDNAVTTTLIKTDKVNMVLNTYNTETETGKYQLHGDVELSNGVDGTALWYNFL